MQHDVRLRAVARAIYDACYPSEDWSPVRFEEAERFGTIHYRQGGSGGSASPRRDQRANPAVVIVRRRGDSPWLIAARNRIRTTVPPGIAHRIASGETLLEAWRTDSCMSIIKLSRLTKLDGWYLIELETGRRVPKPDDLDAIAKALRVSVELLKSQP